MGAAILLLSIALGFPRAAAQDAPRYFAALEEALAPRGAHCEVVDEVRGRCRLLHVSADARQRFEIIAVYSDASDTIYVYVPSLAVADPNADTTPRVLRRIAERNWQALATKLAWNPGTGEVRLSALVHTDSNLDLRALRTLLRTLIADAEVRQRELRRLVREP